MNIFNNDWYISFVALSGKLSKIYLTECEIYIKICCLGYGGVPEWPKGSDCKSDGSAFGGSNPPPSTIVFQKISAGVVQW